MSPILLKFAQDVLQVLAPILLAGVGALGHQLMAWIKTRTSTTKVDSKLAVLDDIIYSAVHDTEQTKVKAQRTPGTQLPPDFAKEAKNQTIKTVREIYGADGMTMLAKDLRISEESLDKLIDAKIETQVYKMKLSRGLIATPPASGGFDPNSFGGMTEDEKLEQYRRDNPAHPPISTPVSP